MIEHRRLRAAVLLALGALLLAAPAVNDDRRWVRRWCLPVVVEPAPAESPEQAIRGVLDAQVAAWNRGDLAGFMEGY